MLTYKYKLYKSDKSNRLDRLIETERRIWNYCTAIQKIAYRLYKTYIPLSKMRKQVANLRKRNPYWMKLNSQTVQEIVDRHDASYQRFFLKLQKRPPKFHKYGKDGSVVYTQSGYKLEPNRLRIKNVGSFGFHKSRDFEKPKRIILKRKGNDYFVFVACDVAPKQHARVDNRTVGIDFGMKTFITFDNGETIENPQFLYNMLHEVQHRNRCLSRRAKNSNNRKKHKASLNRLHGRIANLREDWQWKTVHELCKQCSTACVEDLNVRGWVRHHHWGRKASDIAVGDFIRRLEYVAKRYGTVVVKVDRFYASSHICNKCNTKLDRKLKKDERSWVCPACQAELDRDLNAAQNIKGEGIRLLTANAGKAKSHKTLRKPRKVKNSTPATEGSTREQSMGIPRL